MTSPTRTSEILGATLAALSGSDPDVEAAVQAVLAMRPTAEELAEARAANVRLQDRSELSASMVGKLQRLQNEALALASERSLE